MTRKAPPSRGKRLIAGLIGAVLGATIGYGLVTSGPEPPGGRDPLLILKWSGGLAVVCGALAAADPGALLRPKWKPWRPER